MRRAEQARRYSCPQPASRDAGHKPWVKVQSAGWVSFGSAPTPKAPCPLDRVNRQFRAERLNQLRVSDFAYVLTCQGWVYLAFVVDVFSRRILDWRQSSSMHTEFVLDALEQALYARQPSGDGSLTHHSDRGAQYLSIRYSE